MTHDFTIELTLIIFTVITNAANHQKQPSRDVPRKKCSENMQQIYKRKTHAEVRLL